MHTTNRIAATLALAAGLAWAAAGLAQQPAAPQAAPTAAPKATGMQWAASMINMGGGGSTWVTLHADAQTSAEDVTALKALLKAKGQDALLSQLNSMPQVGWVRIGPRTGYPLPVIRIIPTPTGYRVFGVCGRPITFAGATSQNIVHTDYPIGVVVLEVNKSGENSGQILPAMKFEFNDDGTFDPKVYGTAPLRLLQVKEEEPK